MSRSSAISRLGALTSVESDPARVVSVDPFAAGFAEGGNGPVVPADTATGRSSRGRRAIARRDAAGRSAAPPPKNGAASPRVRATSEYGVMSIGVGAAELIGRPQ